MEQTAVREPDLDRVIECQPWPAGSAIARCRMRVFRPERVVVLTQVEDNPGLSVTNAVEHFGAVVERTLECRLYGAGTGWHLIEHYPRRMVRSATFDLVTFTSYEKGGLAGPRWQPIPAPLEWVREAVTD